MATVNNTYRKVPRSLGLTLMALFIMSSILNSQTISYQSVELPEIAIKNILQGIESENDGVRMNCI